jgi:transcriptional regulator with XRE-family HTH domain
LEVTVIAPVPEFPDPIDPKFDRAAFALGVGWSQAEAARFAGISTRTLRRWLQDELLQQLVVDYSQRWLFAVATRVEQLTLQAIETIADVMVNGESEQVRLKAACFLVDLGPKLREERAFQRRLTVVEETAEVAKLENADKKQKGDGR